MAGQVPLKPLSKSNTERKSRVCISTACEACRAKKAKCSGGEPCLRCQKRQSDCKYRTRSSRTKHSLRLEIEELKEAQRQREALIRDLTAPVELPDVQASLWEGHILNDVSNTLQEVQAASLEQPQPNPNYSYSSIFSKPETSYVQKSFEEQNSIPISCMEKPDNEIPWSNLGNFVPTNNHYELGMSSSLTSSLEMFMNYHDPMMGSHTRCSSRFHPINDYSVGNGCAQSTTDTMSLSFSSGSVDSVAS